MTVSVKLATPGDAARVTVATQATPRPVMTESPSGDGRDVSGTAQLVGVILLLAAGVVAYIKLRGGKFE